MSRVIGTVCLLTGFALIGVSAVQWWRTVDPDKALEVNYVPARDPAPSGIEFVAHVELVNRDLGPIAVHRLDWC